MCGARIQRASPPICQTPCNSMHAQSTSVINILHKIPSSPLITSKVACFPSLRVATGGLFRTPINKVSRTSATASLQRSRRIRLTAEAVWNPPPGNLACLDQRPPSVSRRHSRRTPVLDAPGVLSPLTAPFCSPSPPNRADGTAATASAVKGETILTGLT